MAWSGMFINVQAYSLVITIWNLSTHGCFIVYNINAQNETKKPSFYVLFWESLLLFGGKMAKFLIFKRDTNNVDT